MNPEREQFGKIRQWLDQKEGLVLDAIKFFYEDHPEVKALHVQFPLMVELHESAGVFFPTSEIQDNEKLQKCMRIMQALFVEMGII